MRADGRLEPFLDYVQAALVCMDADLRVTYWNRHAEVMLGWPASEAVGRRAMDLLVAEPDLAAAQAILELIYQGQSWEGEFPVRTADGENVVVSWKSSPVLDEERRLVGVVGIGLDITERHRSEQERALRLEIERAAREQVEGSERRLAFLLEVSEALGAATTLREAFGSLADLAAGSLADMCLIDVVQGERLVRMAAAHADPERQPLMAELERYPPDPQGQHPVARAVRTGQVLWENGLAPEYVRATTRTPQHYELTARVGLSAYICVPLRGRNRIFGTLTLTRGSESPPYTRADVRLAEDLGRRAALAIEAIREVEERRAIAHQLQRSLLPPVLPSFPGYEIGAHYVAAGEGLDVGGDFYDVFATMNGWVMAIGDVCGRGAEAAAVTGLVRHTIRALALHETRPDRVLEQLNQVLAAEDLGERFVTVCLLRFPNQPGDNFTLASAGHPLPVVVRAGGGIEVTGIPGDLLGPHPTVDVTLQTCSALSPGDALVLYTDGVTERRVGRRMLGQGGLFDLLERSRGLPAQDVADGVAEAVRTFQPEPTLDDMAVLVVRAVERPEER